MADPISTASGLLALAGFAFQSSKLLYQAVQSFQSNKRVVRELKEELEALTAVLQSLRETVADTDTYLSTLKLPLLRCGKSCEDFEAVIVKCTGHSTGPRTSFRDWAMLTYMGGDIAGFKAMLAGYKSTILIALGDANMRTSVVTVAVLNEYKQIITNTTSDLEDHLQQINTRLHALSPHGERSSDKDIAERRRIQEERDSTQQCLLICSQVSANIDQIEQSSFKTVLATSNAHQTPAIGLENIASARSVTVDTLNACRERLANTSIRLESQLKDIDIRLHNSSSSLPIISIEQEAQYREMQEEISSIQQCLNICDQASRQAGVDRVNVFEDISMTDDGQQVIVSTIGDLISAKRITAGARSIQVLGQMSDDSVQHLSREHGNVHEGQLTEPRREETQFEHLYGSGNTLRVQPTKNSSGAPK